MRNTLLPLSRVRKTGASDDLQTGFSTRSVLLPESLRVCPFGGAACDLQRPARSPDACGECTRGARACQIATGGGADAARGNTGSKITVGERSVTKRREDRSRLFSMHL